MKATRHEAKKVGLEINVQKAEQMRLNQSSNLSPTDPLAIKGQPINIVDDFKYLGSYVMLKFGLDSHGQHLPNSVNIKVTEGQTQLQDPFI